MQVCTEGDVVTMWSNPSICGNMDMVFAQGAYLPLAQTVSLPVAWSSESLALVLSAACLLLLCLISSGVRTTFARIFAVLAIGSGTGILTWAICVAVWGEEVRGLATYPRLVTTPSEAIGLGAGLLVAGITTLVLPYRMPKGSRVKGEPPASAGVGLHRDH